MDGSPVPPIRLLVAEDEEHLGLVLEHFLRGRGYDVAVVRDGRSALRALATGPFDVALLDVVMPEMDGLEVLRRVQRMPLPPEVIIITGNGTIDTAINAIRLGAYDYISKPYRMAEIDVIVRRAWEKRELRRACDLLDRRLPRRAAPVAHECEEMRLVVETLAAVAVGSEPLVMLGEEGVGKSYLARHVHALSGRSRHALLELDGSGGERVTVGDLLGYAVTGAGDSGDSGVAGALALSERGTLVVDLDRLDAAALVALRRAVSERGYTPAGAEGGRVPLTARVVACTRDSELALSFPAAHRLSVPPLRQRVGDMAALARDLMAEMPCGDGEAAVLDEGVLSVLRAYQWPGNVAELGALLRHAVVAARGTQLGADDIRRLLPRGTGAHPGTSALDDVERAHIETMLVRHNWHQGRAAAALGISTKTLYRKMREYGFQRPRNRRLAMRPPEA